MKLVKTILLVMAFFLLASWQYRILALLLLVVVWRNELRSVRGWIYPTAVVVLLIGMFCVLPRFRYSSSDRVQLIYQDQDGQVVHPPISHYLANVLVPEEEAMNLCIYGVRCFGSLPQLSNWLVEDFRRDDKQGKIANFYTPINALNRSGEFPMSGLVSQLFNQMGWGNSQAVYLIRPKDYDPNKRYPVVFFMHGLMGNWKLYQGIWKDLDDCIVMSVGTKDWSGIYTQADMAALFSKQIPFLRAQGFKVDEQQLHLIGLSNGGSASNIAYKEYAHLFKTIAFVSTSVAQDYRVSSQVLLIGGAKDPSSSSLPTAYRGIQNHGGKAKLYWQADEGHYLLVNQRKEIVAFLNESYR